MRSLKALIVGMCLCQSATVCVGHDATGGPRMGFPPTSSLTLEELKEIIPQDLSIDADFRGVFNRAHEWRQYQALTVCFHSGARAARARVVDVAVEWTKYVNIVFDFGSLTDPRMCSGTNSEHIKIDFAADGHWSYVWKRRASNGC
jgi:hypothetical protein